MTSARLVSPASPITLVDVSQAVTRNARTIICVAKIQGLSGFRGADAVHLATARMFDCDVIFTYEGEAPAGRATGTASVTARRGLR